MADRYNIATGGQPAAISKGYSNGTNNGNNITTRTAAQDLRRVEFPPSPEFAEEDREFMESLATPPSSDPGPALLPPKFKPLSLTELIAMPLKEWIVDQVLGAGDLCMVYGQPGTGKTFVVIDLIFSACLGQQFALRFDVSRPLSVAYCAGEGISGLSSRFAAAAQHYGVEELPNFFFFPLVPQLHVEDNTAHTASIKDFIYDWQQRQAAGEAPPLDLLLVDTLHSATAGADENSARDMGIVLALAKEATQALGCAVVLVHHTNKGGTAERGSSAMRGAMDAMIEIKYAVEGSTSTKAAMCCAKLKDGEAWRPATFDLVSMGDSVRVFWDEPGQVSSTKGKEDEHKQVMLTWLQSHPGQKFTARTLAEVAGISQSQAIKLLPRMVSNGECVTEVMDTSKKSSNWNPLAYKASL